MKDERTYLLHAVEAIDAILSYTVEGREAFYADGKTRDAVIRNIEIIGHISLSLPVTTGCKGVLGYRVPLQRSKSIYSAVTSERPTIQPVRKSRTLMYGESVQLSGAC